MWVRVEGRGEEGRGGERRGGEGRGGERRGGEGRGEEGSGGRTGEGSTKYGIGRNHDTIAVDHMTPLSCLAEMPSEVPHFSKESELSWVQLYYRAFVSDMIMYMCTRVCPFYWVLVVCVTGSEGA